MPNKILLWAEARSEEVLACKPSVCKVSFQLFSWWLLLLSTSHQAIVDQNHKLSLNYCWQCLNWDWQQLILKPVKRYKNLTNILLGGTGLCLRLWAARKHHSYSVREPSVETLTAQSCFQYFFSTEETLWQLLSSNQEQVSVLCFPLSACTMGWQPDYGYCLLISHVTGYTMLFPPRGLSRVSIPMEGLLVSPVLHCVHCRD